MRTLIKVRHDRLKAQTEESHINNTIETVAFNMSLIKRTNPKFYEGILRIYNQVPFFFVDKKEESKEQEKIMQSEEPKDAKENKEEKKDENITDTKTDQPA